MTAVKIKNHIRLNQNRDIPIILLVFKPESRIHYIQSINKNQRLHDQIIVIEEIKMNILAKSCFCPGIITLIGNLISSFNEQNDSSDGWLQEYRQGMGHEIYRSKLSKYFNGKSFSGMYFIQKLPKLSISNLE